MAEKLILFVCLCLQTFCAMQLRAQNNHSVDRIRYKDVVFDTAIVLPELVYGKDWGFASQDQVYLTADVYRPLKDSVKNRPLIIWAPSGNFLPQSAQPQTPAGTKNDSCIAALCRRFAQMGYVAIAMNYRTGWSFNSEDAKVLRGTFLRAVYRASQDGRACVRYFRNYAKNFGADSNRVVFAGIGAGGYIAMQLLYLDKDEELLYPKMMDPNGNPYINNILLGDVEGKGGTPGVSSKINVGVSLGGAVLDTAFIEGGEPPLIDMHGREDRLTPFYTYPLFTEFNFTVAEVSGGFDVMRRATRLGNQTPLMPDFSTDAPFAGFYPLVGVGQDPYYWYSNSNSAETTRAKSYVDTAAMFLAPRLFKILNLETYLIADREAEQPIQAPTIYPNPCAETFSVISEALNGRESTLKIVTLRGETALETQISTNNAAISVDHLPAGVYLVEIKTANRVFSSKLIKQ